MALYETIRSIAALRSDACAIETTSGETCTYRELIERARHLAGGLYERGVRPGDVIACSGLPNSPGHVAFILAVAALDACYVPVMPSFDASAVDRALTMARPMLWVGPRHPNGDAGSLPHADLAALESGDPGALERAEAERNAPSAHAFRMLWTSGSTKQPKLVRWRQQAFVRERRRWTADIGIVESDVFFCRHTLDVAHATDLHVFAALLRGAKVVLADPAAPAAELLAQLARYRATAMSALPSHYEQLVEAARTAPGTDLSALRRPMCGGAYVRPALIKDSARTLKIHIRQIYGSTEFGLGLGNMNDVVQSHHGMYPVEGVVAGLVPLTPDAPADLGMLVLESDCTSEGYLNDEEANADTFQGGAFRTGDVAQRRADGSYLVLGRVTDMLAGSSGPVAAPALDARIAECCPVAESVSLALHPGDYRPDVLVVLRPRSGTSPAQAVAAVEALLREDGLAGTVRAVDTIPRTVVGKADKPLIRRRWAPSPQRSGRTAPALAGTHPEET